MADKFVMKSKRFKLDVYGYIVRVVLSNDVEEARIQWSGTCGNNYERDGITRGICWNADNIALSVVFLPFESDIGYVVHELFHVVWRVMSYIGAQHENEIMAYTLGYLTREVCRFIATTGDLTKPAKHRHKESKYQVK